MRGLIRFGSGFTWPGLMVQFPWPGSVNPPPVFFRATRSPDFNSFPMFPPFRFFTFYF